MSRPVRALPLFGALALAAVLAAGACTTEFITEGGNCDVDGDCETGEVCRGVAGAAGGEPTGVCLRACDEDRDCVGARDEVCRLDPDGVSGVCGRVCVIDTDCPGQQLCRFDRCVDPVALADLASVEPPTDSMPGDGAADVGAGDTAVGDGAADAATDVAVMADAADAAPDMSPVDMRAPDAAPVDMQAPDAAPDVAP